MDRALRAAERRRAKKEAAARAFAGKLSSKVMGKTVVAREPKRSAEPFRRTFDSAKEAAERFYANNIDFLRPVLESGEPREAVREWLRSNAHGRTGRMKVKDLSETPWAKKMLASPDPVRAALRNVFSHAKGRRWDRVDWDAIRALGELLAELGPQGAGPGGWTWFPIAIEDDDAKILDRLSVDGDPDAYRRYAASLSQGEVDEVVKTYAQEIQRLTQCMTPTRRRTLEARLKEIERWKDEGIPDSVCGQKVYAGHTCDLEPIHGELRRLREACDSDAAYVAWRNESVRRTARPGSVAEAAEDDAPVELVPVSAFEADAPVEREPCTASEAARVMGKLAAKSRRENAQKRRVARQRNAAQRRAEREQLSAERKAQREERKPAQKAAPPEGPKPKPKPDVPLWLTAAERIAIGGTARDKALYEKYGKGRVGHLLVKAMDGYDGDLTDEESRELEAVGMVRNDVLTDDGWVLYKLLAERESKSSPEASKPLEPEVVDSVPVLEVFNADVMRQVAPKHVAKVIKVLVEKEGLLPPGHRLSARTPHEGVVYLSVSTRGKMDTDAVNEGMGKLFPGYRDGRGQSELHLVPTSWWSGSDRLKSISSKYADTLRVLAQREAGVQTAERTVLDEATPTVNDGPVRPAVPKKCGTLWCAEVVGVVRVGDPIRVVTRRGQRWDAVVTEVVRTTETKSKGLRSGGQRSLVRSVKLPPELLRGRPGAVSTSPAVEPALSARASRREGTGPATASAADSKRQGALVSPEQEGFALTHPKGTAAAHGKSAGTGGTQSTLPGVSRKVSATKLAEMKERKRR